MTVKQQKHFDVSDEYLCPKTVHVHDSQAYLLKQEIFQLIMVNTHDYTIM